MNCEIALLKKEGTHSNFSQLDNSSNSAISVKSKGLTNIKMYVERSFFSKVTCHFQQSSWIPIVFPVPKILVIDVTMVPDVVPDVALLKIYCLHIIPGCPMIPVDPNCVSCSKDSSF